MGVSMAGRIALGSGKWMQKVSEETKAKGHKGVFKAKAEHAGMSTKAYAEKEKHAEGKTGKQARLALAYMGARH